MEELREHVSAVLHRGETSSSNHASCLRELNELLGVHGEDLIEAIYIDLTVFLFNKQLKTEPASRLRELMAKFIAAEDREKMEPEVKTYVPKLNQKCIGLLKQASHVSDNDVRACALTMLATIVKASGAKFSDNVHKDLCDVFLMRLEDKISAVRSAAGDGLRSIWEFLAPKRQSHLEPRLRPMASDDTRSEVRAAALRCLPMTFESAAVLIERTGDYDSVVRTAAMERLVDLPLDFLNMDAVHTLAGNAYRAALNYEATQASEHREEEPIPMSVDSEATNGRRDNNFSPASRRRREEKALFSILNTLLKSADGDLWTFLTWFPLETNPMACIFVLRTLFTHGVPFPENFTTRKPIDETDAQKSIIMAVVHCERLSKTPGGREEIESLVPEPVTIVEELVTSPMDSAKMIFLLKLTKFADYSDEGGRSEMERALLELLSRKPSLPTVKVILQALVLVQDAVQIYTTHLVDIIASSWIDLNNKHMDWEPVLGFTLELLNSLPSDLEEFPALLRIESDILGPAAKPVMQDTNYTNTNIQTLYTKCIAVLGKFVAKTREEHYADLCFWVTNPKKSMPLRGAAITALIEWFSIPTIETEIKGEMDPTSLATHLLKLASDHPPSSPITFSSVLGLSRLMFNGLVDNHEVIGKFLYLSFVPMISEPRLRSFLSSFYPTWASYPEAIPRLCSGFLQSVRQLPDDVPNPVRKAFYKYLLKLIFGALLTSSDHGRYNDTIGRKVLKIIYEGSRDDAIDILKDLDFYGVSGKEKEVLNRMVAKVTRKLPHLKDTLVRVSHTMETTTEPKNRSTVRFPDPPVKKEKPGTPLPGRASLDSEAHAKLKESMDDAARQRKRSREEMEASSERVKMLPTEPQPKTPQLLSHLAQKYAKYDEYQLKTSISEASPRKDRPKDTYTPTTPTKPANSSNQKFYPVTEPKPKRAKIEEVDLVADPEHSLIGTNELIKTLQSRLKKPEDIAALQDIANQQRANDSDYEDKTAITRRLASRRQIQAPMEIDEDSDFEVRSVSRSRQPRKATQGASQLPLLEPLTSRPKRGRSAELESSSVPQSPSRSRAPKPSLGSSLAPFTISDHAEDNQSEFESDMLPPESKKSKSRETSASSSIQSPRKVSAPSPAQSAIRSLDRMTLNDNSTQTKMRPAGSAMYDIRTDWKKKHFPILASSTSKTMVVGLLGFSTHREEAKSIIDRLALLGIPASEVVSFEKGSLSHLIVRHGERSLTSSCYGITGCWIMSPRWVDACDKLGSAAPETGFGTRITRALFHNQTLVFSPGLTANATLKRLATTMVKESGGNTTINNSKANTMLCVDEDDINELESELDNMPLLSLNLLLDDLHKCV